jgi:hypothetical protein
MPAAEDHYSGDDRLDSGLHDTEQLEEIQLMSDLMIAASRRKRGGRLPQQEIDAILGLREIGGSPDGEPADWIPGPRAPSEEH